MLIPGPVAALVVDLRPQFHFTAPAGWLNDPNGLVYENGNYHLFYQHNPFGTNWGNMTWGHAISRDLIHWQHLPEAIEPDSLGTIFSGSAVIDKANTAGLGAKALICIYTAAGGTNDASKGKPFTQCLAWSIDGKTLHKLNGNPIVPHIAGENRDPKVFWHAPSKQWIMALYLTDDRYGILGSKNLTEWKQLSEFKLADTSECPDFFELPLDGDSKKSKWVFWGANGNYQVGDFDGSSFHPASEVKHSHYGNTGYAAQTYSNAPRGRRIQISWFRDSNFPNVAWNQQMGFPNTLALRTTSSGPTLSFWPVDEVRSIRKKATFKDGKFYSIGSGLIDFDGSWAVPSHGEMRLIVNGVEIKFDASTGKLIALGQEAKVDTASGQLDLRILADRTSIEIYAQKGLVYMPLFVLPGQEAGNGVRPPNGVTLGDWKGTVHVYELTP